MAAGMNKSPAIITKYPCNLAVPDINLVNDDILHNGT